MNDFNLEQLDNTLALIGRTRLQRFRPYDRQLEFFNLGATKRERLLMAANQVGKTLAGAVEMAYHLTGLYPSDWKGRRFTKPINAWACGETSQKTRDILQTKLCGPHNVENGLTGGLIPKELLIARTLSHGLQGSFDQVTVRHVSGENSTLGFRSCEQGRARFASDTLDVVWCDEEPSLEIYTECLARISATQGIVYTTFTPLLGFAHVVPRFLQDTSPEAIRDRAVVKMGLRDALHIPEAEREKIIAGYPPHERRARTEGEPMLGEGAVFFGIPEDSIKIPPIPDSDIPREWAKIWGIDFGIGHPFAAVLLAWNRDDDVVYLIREIRIADMLPEQHVKLMRAQAADVPVAWPRDGLTRQIDGEQLAIHYSDDHLGAGYGMRMLDDHAQFPDGSVSTEAAVMELLTRMQSRRFLVSASCHLWFEEFRSYHRKDGKIVKLHDDLMSATRHGIMMLRHAKPGPLGPTRGRTPGSQWRNHYAPGGNDFDLFTGRPLDEDRLIGREFIGIQPPDPITGLRWDARLERWVK
jgi:phage terminase large subunit-like protein